jgi:hypothetical protein
MSGWGQEAWGADPWGSGNSPPIPEGGDGHLPLVMGIGEIPVTGTESVRAEVSPIWRFDNVGATQMRIHVLGEAAGLDVGKTITIRFRYALSVLTALASCPVQATVTVDADGLFSASSSVFTSQAAAGKYYMTTQTDDAVGPSPTLKSVVVIVEVFA